jgi:hypothetical protein
LRHGGAQDAGRDRLPLGVVGVQHAFRRCLVDHLGQLPPQIHRILHTDFAPLSTDRGMHVCGVAGQQHSSFPIGRRLPSHIGEPRDPGGTAQPVIRPPHSDEQLAEITQGRLTGLPRGALLSPRPAPAPRRRAYRGHRCPCRRGGCPAPALRASRLRRPRSWSKRLWPTTDVAAISPPELPSCEAAAGASGPATRRSYIPQREPGGAQRSGRSPRCCRRNRGSIAAVLRLVPRSANGGLTLSWGPLC